MLNAVESWCDDNPDIREVAIARVIWDIDRSRLGDQEHSRKIANRLRTVGWTRSNIRTRGVLPDGSKTDKAFRWIRPNAPIIAQCLKNLSLTTYSLLMGQWGSTYRRVIEGGFW